MDDAAFDAATWDHVIEGALFRRNKGFQLVRHQIESYDDFLQTKLHDVIRAFNPIQVHHAFCKERGAFQNVISINVENVTVQRPEVDENSGVSSVVTPQDARQRGLTYASRVYADMVVTVGTLDAPDETKVLKNILLGKVPVMVKSRACAYDRRDRLDVRNPTECRFDYGGYFVVSGNEKVLISQDRFCENRTFVFASVRSTVYSYVAEVRSVPENRLSVAKIANVKLMARGNQHGQPIRVNIHHVKPDIPLFVLMKALGARSDLDAIDLISLDAGAPSNRRLVQSLQASVVEASEIACQKDALLWISKPSFFNVSGKPKELMTDRLQRVAALKSVMTTEFLPHVGPDFRKKALYIGSMVRKLLACADGSARPDDRDSYVNKRVETPGVLLAGLFRQYYSKMVKEIKVGVQTEIRTGSWKVTRKMINVVVAGNVHKLVKAGKLESGLKYAFATGNWGVKTNVNKQGVSQVLGRMSYNAMLSHLRKVTTHIANGEKVIEPRKLHVTQWGVLCPAETPEGTTVGLVKTLAFLANVTIASNSYAVRELVMADPGLERLDPGSSDSLRSLRTKCNVIINGDVVGVHLRPDEMFRRLKSWKRSGVISPHTCVAWHVSRNELCLCTEGGRMVRPLYVVDPDTGMPRATPEVFDGLRRGVLGWADLLTLGVVEYLDVEEADCALIAMRRSDLGRGTRCTHMELHPSTILGVSAGLIPFSNHNQSPRVCYESAMSKQGVAIFLSNFRNRYDAVSHVLNCPQKALASTRIARIVNMDKIPCGCNVILAIACYGGWNQEDSVILNQSSVERGMLASTMYRTYRDAIQRNHSTGQEEMYARPDASTTALHASRRSEYDKLGPDGFVPENTRVASNDVIIGKVMPTAGGAKRFKDCSVRVKTGESGVVDRNCNDDRYFVNRNGDGYTTCKVRVRHYRVPMVGDKFATTSGQKGSCGMVFKQHDMPFSASGIVPDVIMNPHAIPSRMTIGQLLECLTGKVCATTGRFGDATPFDGASVERLGDELQRLGMDRHCDEVMYDPKTGRQITMSVFIGPTYYQRLKHMVADKVHSRASGPVVQLTRQPAEGKSSGGGLRIGEMERDCAVAHGAMSFLRERHMDMSDGYRVWVCKRCGFMANVNPSKAENVFQCRRCGDASEHFVPIEIPYACKLFTQEVNTMGVGMRFLTE